VSFPYPLRDCKAGAAWRRVSHWEHETARASYVYTRRQHPAVYFSMSSSAPPPSMGPGARPVGPGSSATGTPVPIESILSQVREIRSHYSISLDDARTHLNISYMLKDRHRGFSLPFDNLPLNPSTQWLLYGGPARRLATGTFVTDILRGAENMAHRDLTQSEAEGHALHASRRMLYGFAAVVSSASIGAAFSLAGRKTMKFPLRRPQPLERYDNFPNRYLPILRGQYARAMWHITRANVYTFFAFLLLQPLYSSMGDNALTVGLYRDSRTNAVLKEMKANKDPNRAFQISRIGSNVERGSPEDRRQVFGQTAKQREGLEKQRGGKVYEDPDPQGYYSDNTEGVVNDYSGEQSYESDAGDQAFTDGNGDGIADADSGMLTDRQMAVREARQSNPNSGPGSFTGVPAYQRGVQQKSQQQQQQQQAYERGQESAADDFIFDDASPSDGRGMLEDISTNQTPVTKSGMGGAWSRVRRGEQTVGKVEDQNQKGVKARGAQTRSSVDSFSFSKSDEERQLAKESAQRDFDRMVEAERKGVGGIGSGRGNEGGGSAWGGRPSGRGGL
jgi:hypothetical protein